MKCILFSDIDGTIIKDNCIISNKDRYMLNQMREYGHLLVFCTGRNEIEATNVLWQNKLSYDYLILNNGAKIIDNKGMEIFKQAIPYNIAFQILKYCSKYKNIYVECYDSERKKCFGILNGNNVIYYCSNFIITYRDFVKEVAKSKSIDIITLKPEEKKFFSRLLKVTDNIEKHWDNEVEIVFNTCFLDITSKGQTKGNALQKLISLLDGRFESYCIGDSFNDISMFPVVDHSFTFLHSDKQIKKYATKYVNYVYEIVEEIFLKNKKI